MSKSSDPELRRTFIETTTTVERDEIQSSVPDNTVGLMTADYGEEFPEAPVFDLERLRRAFIAFRNEFGDERYANVALVNNGDGMEGIAFYTEDNRQQAIVVPSRIRQEELNDGGE